MDFLSFFLNRIPWCQTEGGFKGRPKCHPYFSYTIVLRKKFEDEQKMPQLICRKGKLKKKRKLYTRKSKRPYAMCFSLGLMELNMEYQFHSLANLNIRKCKTISLEFFIVLIYLGRRTLILMEWGLLHSLRNTCQGPEKTFKECLMELAVISN